MVVAGVGVGAGHHAGQGGHEGFGGLKVCFGGRQVGVGLGGGCEFEEDEVGHWVRLRFSSMWWAGLRAAGVLAGSGVGLGGLGGRAWRSVRGRSRKGSVSRKVRRSGVGSAGAADWGGGIRSFFDLISE